MGELQKFYANSHLIQLKPDVAPYSMDALDILALEYQQWPLIIFRNL
jgi:hypothetical protein